VTRLAGGGSCGGDMTLPGAAGRVTAADCEGGSAAAGRAVTLPGWPAAGRAAMIGSDARPKLAPGRPAKAVCRSAKSAAST
jgi:hypothetical protein